MARMHARTRGSSGSHRPLVEESPEWVPLSNEEIEERIVKMAKDGVTSARIGLILRDQYGVPSVKLALGRSITEVMEENQVQPRLPEDLISLMRKAINLNEHLKENPKDTANRRNLQLVESKIRRLAAYYKGQGTIPQGWKYSLRTAELQIE
ncbi:MAG: 30S ribosomal protein S15 [Methanomassiliicoccales archaeon]